MPSHQLPPPPHPPLHCSIVPPYLLEALASSDDPRAAAHAQATLDVDAELRQSRRTAGLRADRRPAHARGGGWPRAPPPGRCAPSTTRSTAPRCPAPWCAPRATRATGDQAVTEAYDGLGGTWQLWQEAYGRNSLDGKGLPLVASVHFGTNYDNAFWDGTQMVFGDGDGVIFLPFTRSVDVIGHELAHGVTQYTSGLNYQDQSGALNESVSDVFGVLVKQRLLGQSADQADWLVGAELLAPGVNGVALRSMAAPGTAYDDPRLGKDPQPAHMSGYVDTTDDNGGVHINSGIPNKAFHVVATTLGGNAWEVAGQVWVDTITGDISADCDFATFARLTRRRRHRAARRRLRGGRGGAGRLGCRGRRAPVPPHRPLPAPPTPARHPTPAPAPPGPAPAPGPGHRGQRAPHRRVRRAHRRAHRRPGRAAQRRRPGLALPARRRRPARPGRRRSPAGRGCPTPTATACAARRRPSTSSCPSSSSPTTCARLLERTLGTSDG